MGTITRLFDERRAIGVEGDARVDVDVGHRRRFAIEHRPAADAGQQRKFLAFPQRPDGVLVHVVAEITVAQHEGGTVGTADFAGHRANDRANTVEAAGRRQVLHRLHEACGASSIRLWSVVADRERSCRL